MVRKAMLVPVIVALSCVACTAPSAEMSSRPGGTTVALVTETPSNSPDRAPTVTQLEEMLQRAIDPAIPAKDKLGLVQGATDADIPLFEELVRLRQSNPQVSWHIDTPVLEQPGVAKAHFSVLMDGTNQLAYATFVFDGTWKIERSYACQMIEQVGRDSPSCH